MDKGKKLSTKMRKVMHTMWIKRRGVVQYIVILQIKNPYLAVFDGKGRKKLFTAQKVDKYAAREQASVDISCVFLYNNRRLFIGILR